MKEVLRRLLLGTPLEAPARAAYRALTGRGTAVVPAPPAAATAPVDLNELYNRQTARVMERVLARDSICIDVGCHEGEILDEMLRLAPDGRHYAFEPLPHLHDLLARKYAGAANVRLFDAALSDAPGESTFQHVVTNPGYSGLLRRRFDRPHEDVVEIRVRLLRLDDVLPPQEPIRLVKIDVEGAELQVLRGAQGMLRRCRPYVIFEHGLGAADCYGTRPEMVHDLLADCGLRVSLMQDWLSGGPGSPLDREAFAAQFDRAINYYFLAHP